MASIQDNLNAFVGTEGFSAGNEIKVDVDTRATATTLAGRVILMGFLVAV